MHRRSFRVVARATVLDRGLHRGDAMDLEDRICGCLLGGAVGDAIGLPFEGMAPARIFRRVGDRPLQHALIGRRGMLSDDSEHACMTAQALLAARGDPQVFARSLAWRLRGWLLGLPASIGFGTLRALLRLWLGWSPERSGVGSAGNGPAMRAAILGVCVGADVAKLRTFVERSTRMTHSDPRALAGALAIAQAAAHVTYRGTPAEVLSMITRSTADAELIVALELAQEHLARGAAAEAFAAALGQQRGVSGYIHHTVPVALYCWLCGPDDVRGTVERAVRLGGDTDTVAAIAGGLAGAWAGRQAVPAQWLAGLWETPRSVRWICALARRLATEPHAGPLPLRWPLLVPRNLLFTLVVLGHGFLRVLRLR